MSDDALDRLRAAFRANDLTLYLGAGVSVASGLPTWERLVLAMYFTAISRVHLPGWRPFPNYLFAIAEWQLAHREEPLEITARKIRLHYDNQDDFLADLRATLYAGFGDDPAYLALDPRELRSGNTTLDAVARLCEAGLAAGAGGVRAVVTYNYDCLLEVALNGRDVQPLWRPAPLRPGTLPIYHVHGYVPPSGEGSTASQIVFTEDQYHLAAQDAYSWSNLVQLHSMSGTVGLMIGLSLSDRNMRRLLDALTRTALPCEQYALLQMPPPRQPSEADLRAIHERAITYMERFERSGIKGVARKGPSWQEQIRGILEAVEQVGVEQNTKVLKELGVTPIWYKDHAEIPGLLAHLSG
ncbi:SIR2 family protein [Rhodocaloribacter litoris]|uniref:SIR2 family protein n=1 Tax=Rhodocaloribacter litoris TaxID=2558931 RepID=UPI00141FCFF0|nr:SIR2 family protein [Rhodocaloribacter litoris]QXD14525.1 SIR2 family protein [Rhodocaloribacter litoris]